MSASICMSLRYKNNISRDVRHYEMIILNKKKSHFKTTCCEANKVFGYTTKTSK